MIWAIKDGVRIEAKPKDKASCPICKAEVISKCGIVKKWHWAHKDITDCDSWTESESEWHSSWKNKFPKEQQELVIEKDEIKHRADIKLQSGKVIELQNSSISIKDIEDRENFYEDMIWLLNGKTFAHGLNFKKRLENNIFTFRWKNPPKILWFMKNRKYIHLIGKIGPGMGDGNLIFEVGKIYEKIPCGGWGRVITMEDFINEQTK